MFYGRFKVGVDENHIVNYRVSLEPAKLLP